VFPFLFQGRILIPVKFLSDCAQINRMTSTIRFIYIDSSLLILEDFLLQYHNKPNIFTISRYLHRHAYVSPEYEASCGNSMNWEIISNLVGRIFHYSRTKSICDDSFTWLMWSGRSSTVFTPILAVTKSSYTADR
jgi:hypothetical protein